MRTKLRAGRRGRTSHSACLPSPRAVGPEGFASVRAVGPEGFASVRAVGPEGLPSARVALHAASLALRASLLLRRGLACARPSGPPAELHVTPAGKPCIAHGPVQVGRAHSLHRAPWLPCAMGRVGRWHTDATCRPEGVNALAGPCARSCARSCARPRAQPRAPKVSVDCTRQTGTHRASRG